MESSLKSSCLNNSNSYSYSRSHSHPKLLTPSSYTTKLSNAQVSGTSNNPLTSPIHHQYVEPCANPDNAFTFLANFNLVAEAAKRAQMAILVRDLESVDI